MPNFEKRGDKVTKRFNALIDGHIVQKRTPGFKTRREAEIYVTEYFIKNPEHVVKRTPSGKRCKILEVSFENALIDFSAEKKLEAKESTLYSYNNTIQKWILPFFKGKNILKLRDEDFEDYKDWLTKNDPSIPNRRKNYSILLNIMRFACKKYKINPNHAELVGNFPKKRSEKAHTLTKNNYWIEDEFMKFINCVDNVLYKTFFCCLYFTGCRYGEACALKFSDVTDYTNIEKTVTYKTLDGTRYKITPTKSTNSMREVKNFKILNQIYSNYLDYLNKNNIKYSQNDFFFNIQKPLPPNSARRYFNDYIKKSGVKKIRIHDLRHSHVSYLLNHLEGDLSLLYVIAERIGDTPEMVLKVYGHLFKKAHEDLVKKMDSIWEENGKNIL